MLHIIIPQMYVQGMLSFKKKVLSRSSEDFMWSVHRSNQVQLSVISSTHQATISITFWVMEKIRNW